MLAAALLALGAAPAAASTTPQLVVTSPLAGSATNRTTLSVAGEVASLETASWCEVSVNLYAGATTESKPIESLSQNSPGACSWVTEPAAGLEPGTYTVEAVGKRWWFEGEEEEREEPEHSQPITFTIDTTAPAPALAAPSPGASIVGSSLAVSGSAGTATGDLPAVTVAVFSGGEAAGTPVEAIELPSAGGAWSGTLAGLAPGTYTLQAQQSDWAGNVGVSAPAPITVSAAPAPPPPSASFSWFPEVPRVGETVTLAANWTATSSPVVAFAWGLTGTEPLRPGHATATAIFSTPGPHVVRLQVTDAEGRSATASRTITVRHQALALMQPFPIVRIAGRETSNGVKLTLVTVSAPVSALVTVRIRGTGIRSTSQSRLAAAGKRPAPNGTALLSFPRFARSLKAGIVLEIRVTKAGDIGKLTRFIPRRAKLPTRTDSCLSTGGQPMRCPAS